MLFDTLIKLDSTSLLAYLDPSLASTQFQILLAGLLSAGFFLKSSIVHAKDLLNRIFKKVV